MFLLKSDYGAQIKQDLLNAVLDSNEAIRTDAELSAQSELESYLRGRYDLAKIFIDVQPWAAAQQYAAGAVVFVMGSRGSAAGIPLIYVATRANIDEQPGAPLVEPTEPEITPEPQPLEASAEGEPPLESGGEPAAEPEPLPAAWELKDPRHPLIKTYLIDCTLYLIHCRQNPRAVPQIRQDRYDQVLAWLNLVRQGKISPGLPLLPDVATDGTTNRESIRARGGSGSRKLQNSY